MYLTYCHRSLIRDEDTIEITPPPNAPSDAQASLPPRVSKPGVATSYPRERFPRKGTQHQSGGAGISVCVSSPQKHGGEEKSLSFISVLKIYLHFVNDFTTNQARGEIH